MNLKFRRFLLFKHSLSYFRRFTTSSTITTTTTSNLPSHNHTNSKPLLSNPSAFPNINKRNLHSSLHLTHSQPQQQPPSMAVSDEEDEDEDVKAMNDFLSRFVHIMRGNLTETYPHCEKKTIDEMLKVIVDKLIIEMEKGGNLEERLVNRGENGEFSDDLWKTVLEVSNDVYQEMEREKKKEKLKKFLQCDEVKGLARFASEVGVRGDMLHELRFKWAREEMEKAEFYEQLESIGEAATAKAEAEAEAEVGDSNVDGGGESESDGLPKRHGRIKYKLYGLDMSGSQWKDVADRLHEAEEVVWAKEAKEITGKCKLVNERIVGLKRKEFDSEVSALLDEWKELLQPSRVDWMLLLERIKEKDSLLYLKMAERVLDEPSFQANSMDYSKLVQAHAKENKVEDIDRILTKMSERGVPRDVLTLTALLHVYSKSNCFEQAEAVYQELNNQGFKLNRELYNSMIMVHVNAGNPKLAEKLLREMELREIQPTEDMYLAVLRGFSKHGDIIGAQRIMTAMQFAGFSQTAETCICLIEASAKSGNPEDARRYFRDMSSLGFKPDDRSTSFMIAAYEKKNKLELALDLLLQLEKDGFEPGVLTYSVLIDWFGKLQLVDEAEQMLTKMAQLGEVPPFKLQVSLFDMYARAGNEKKTLQSLGVLEAKKDLLEHQDFERIVMALLNNGSMQDAERILGVMEAQGFTPSESLKMKLMATEAFAVRKGTSSGRPRMR